MFEYVYTEKQYKRSIRLLLLAWATNFSLRFGLFAIYGYQFTYSTANLLLTMVSGILVGLIIRTFMLRKKSALVPPEVVIGPDNTK